MNNSIALTLALVLYISLACAQHATQIDSLVSQYYAHDKPGIALSILQEGKTMHTLAKGIACIEHNTSISDSTAFQIASVSKQFTSYLALRLEQEGKLSMEADIRDYLPELKHLAYKITLTQLANHTHGLPNISELAAVKGFGDADRMWHRDVVHMALRIKTFNFKPGARFQYNNTGFVLLAEIIERQSEMPFQQALEKYIFNPLGMDHTVAESSPNLVIKNKSESYVATPSGYQRKDNNIMSNGSSGIRTTIKDLSLWTQFFQKDILDQQSPFLQMIKDSRLNNGELIPYGLGLETKNYRGTKVVFHGGGTAGHRAYVLHIPEYEFSVLILGNGNDFWPLKLAYEVVDLLLDHKLAARPLAKTTRPTLAQLEKYMGMYEFCLGKYFVFTRHQDSLFMSELGGDGMSYVEPLSENSFSFPFYPESKFTFTENRVELNIADFVYVCPRANPIQKEYSRKELSSFIGFYRNETLNTIYEIVLDEGQLIARHPINYDVHLSGLVDNSFFSTQYFFSRADFKKNKSGVVTGLKLSGQNFNELWFERID